MRVSRGEELNLFGPDGEMKPADFRLPDWVPEELWNEWFEWRKKRKFPVTPRVMRHCVRMLEEHVRNGYTAEMVLETALVRGWRDLWEPTGGKQNGQKPSYIATRVDNAFRKLQNSEKANGSVSESVMGRRSSRTLEFENPVVGEPVRGEER